ncbi:SPW repeat protein [Halostella sp. PRR32]|uniref:SPW repeat protein n=1 Tax=Halostella sp. PRR32 TaxID=3098147 RepID=UPI002B1D5ADA|nr:SPW repeat protein [Halostella sp. PRR32]
MADSPDRDTTADTTTTGDQRATDDRRTVDDRTVDLRGSKLLAGLASLIGGWIAVSPFVYGDLGGATQLDAAGWNNIIIGAAIFLVAGYNFYRMSKDMNVSEAAAGLTLLLGLWIVVSAIAVFDMGTTGLLWSTVVSGLVAAAIGGYNAYKGRQARDTRTAARTT